MAKKVTEKDMYPYAYQALRKRYPLNKGWKIIEQDHHGTYIPDFVCTKNGRKYIYKVPADAKFKCKATQADVDQINSYASKLAGPNVIIEDKILIYPAGTDTSIVPEDIDVIYLRAFACD